MCKRYEIIFVQIEVQIQVRTKCEACGKCNAWLRKQPLKFSKKREKNHHDIFSAQNIIAYCVKKRRNCSEISHKRG